MNAVMDYNRTIECAAIKNGDGMIWTGKRHHNVIATIIQATGEKPIGAVQGFVTMERNESFPQGRFVDRAEARKLCVETGQVKAFCHPSELFSEDLY